MLTLTVKRAEQSARCPICTCEQYSNNNDAAELQGVGKRLALIVEMHILRLRSTFSTFLTTMLVIIKLLSDYA